MKTCCSILYLNTLSSPINLTNRLFNKLPTLNQCGVAHPWHFSVLGNKTLCTVQKNSKKCSLALLHFLWRHLGRIFSISQVDFACLIKSSSLTSCLTSPSSLLPGAYSSAGATSQTDCCPAGMGLAAHRGPEAQSPCAFV